MGSVSLPCIPSGRFKICKWKSQEKHFLGSVQLYTLLQKKCKSFYSDKDAASVHLSGCYKVTSSQATKNIYTTFGKPHIKVLWWYHRKYVHTISLQCFTANQCFFPTWIDIYMTGQKKLWGTFSIMLFWHFEHIYMISYWYFFVAWDII